MTWDTNSLLKKVQRKAIAAQRLVKSRITGRPVMVYGSDNPNYKTMEFLQRSASNSKIIAEIGVARGSTSEAILRWLGGAGMLHLFEFEDCMKPVIERLRRTGFLNFMFHTNSRRLLDSYNYSLMKLMRNGTAPSFDYVYLDGAHTWNVDALCFLLIDKMLKPGGYIDFDDYDWTYAASPSVNPRVFPATKRLFTSEQINTAQVKLIVEILVRRDERYEEVLPNKIFRKLR